MQNNVATQEKTIGALLWKFTERVGAQLIQFIVSIVLARILAPDDYGVIALITVFTQIAAVFVQSGFGTALLRKFEVDELDYNSVFWVTFSISLIAYAILFVSAPYIAVFYDSEMLTSVLRVLSVNIILGSVNSVQNVKLRREMRFKTVFTNTITATIISGIVGITMAVMGYGVWALVGQQFTSTITVTIVMLFTVRWYPKLQFSITRIKTMFSFGWKMLCSSLLDTVYNNIYSLIIGLKYSTTDLAYWNKAKQFPSLMVDNINGSLGAVMLPVMAQQQNDIPELRKTVRHTLTLSMYIVVPMMVGLGILAEPIITLVLTEKWLPAVPFMQVWCFTYAFYPIHTINLQSYQALGRSDVFLKLEIYKKIMGVTILVIAMPFGLMWMAYSKILSAILSTIINSYPNKKLLKYTIFDQYKDIMLSALPAILMGVAVYCIGFIEMNYILLMAIQVVAGVFIYWILSAVLRNQSYLFIKDSILNKFKDKKV
ncbi:MAG: lipopolysaccharide biosynthesis protein [Bacillota bacterium]